MRRIASLEAEWRPRSTTEQLLVEQMVTAQWKLVRLEVGERSIYMQTMAADKQMALLDRFSVQRGRLERSFSKAVHELEHLRKNGLVEVAEPAQMIVAQPVPERITDFGVEPRPAVLPSLVMSPAIQCDSR